MKDLKRSRKDKVFCGVCGGISKETGIPSWMFRVLFILMIFFGMGIGIILYGLLWIFMPLEPKGELLNEDTKEEE